MKFKRLVKPLEPFLPNKKVTNINEKEIISY